MPSGASRAELLAARDARQAAIDRAVARLRAGGEGELGAVQPAAPGSSIVAMSLAIPGEEKTPPGAFELFAWASRRVRLALPGGAVIHAGRDALGPFELFAGAATPVRAKLACVAVESADAAARLADLDVLAPDGRPLDRAALGLPPRACLLCGEPARECIGARRHGTAELASAARELLAGFEGFARA